MLRIIKGALFLLLLAGCSTGIEKTACQQLDEIDLKMLNIIKQINEEYQHDEKFLAALKDAQIYWTQYKNRQVKAIFPLSLNKYDYEVGECKCEIYRDLTVLRVNELQKWLDGVDKNSVCKGSYKVK